MSWSLFAWVLALMPVVIMLLVAFWALTKPTTTRLWLGFKLGSWLALVVALVVLGLELQQFYFSDAQPPMQGWLASSLLGAWVSVLVQFLGTVIGRYSAVHLQDEPRQARYVAALAAVLACVHWLLLANHWWVLIVAWAAIGFAMHQLLVFYPERSFAQLAAHKKRVADRLADVLLIAAALCAWQATHSWYLSDLWLQASQGQSSWLSASGVLLALAVILRTALLPVHGWLIQVMEAPTPVSALLHAGVVNLGGFVLVLFAPLLNVTEAARWLLIGFGLVSAVLAGTVMLTRVSVKVDLAWSTLGQMGFMLMECGLGLYSLAVLHLLGHSLYKAHSFLSASSRVQQARFTWLVGHHANSPLSLWFAPCVSLAVVFSISQLFLQSHWPWWWLAVLALAWAPLLWLPQQQQLGHSITGMLMVVGFTFAAFSIEHLPVGATLMPFQAAGPWVLWGMSFMYAGFVAVQLWPAQHRSLRHWIYAGFYLDEIYTLLALKLWPANWVKSQPLVKLGSSFKVQEAYHG